MGRAAKVQSFFESAMTDFTEQLRHKYCRLHTNDNQNQTCLRYIECEKGRMKSKRKNE